MDAAIRSDTCDVEDARPPTPSEVFAEVRDRSGVVFLDGRAGRPDAPWSILAWEPQRSLLIDIRGALLHDPLQTLDEFLDGEAAAGRTVIGMLAYELGRFIEPRSGRRPLPPNLPLVWLASYARTHAFDHRSGVWRTEPEILGRRRRHRARMAPLRPIVESSRYQASFDRVRSWIASGDVYQVNLSVGFEAAFEGSAAELYERIASAHAAPYGAYVDAGDWQLLSISPELFLRRDGDRLTTRPIKGTRPRGVGPGEDQRMRDDLLADSKERAEHVMIVDLERNDLGRIATTGSVCVDDAWKVETYPGLHHLESSVSCRLRSALRFSDILRATFPGGSITGAPKLRAMQIIDALEEGPRGPYTGAILHHEPDGSFSMSVAIRTATISGGTLRYRAGGGLVWDSRAASEWNECLLKARAFADAASDG